MALSLVRIKREKPCRKAWQIVAPRRHMLPSLQGRRVGRRSAPSGALVNPCPYQVYFLGAEAREFVPVLQRGHL